MIDGVSTWVGKAAAWLIIGLMILVCKNDVEERWDVIVSQIRELIG